MLDRAERRVLRAFGRFERPVAWVIFVGAVVIFGGVATDLIATGEFRWLTLVAAADLALTGYGVLRVAYDDEPETG